MKRVTGMTKRLVGSFAMIMGRKTKMFLQWSVGLLWAVQETLWDWKGRGRVY